VCDIIVYVCRVPVEFQCIPQGGRERDDWEGNSITGAKKDKDKTY
jgi:hypothetical protein